MLKGFKDFLLRGNVIDLSVAVVMGAAFGAIVTAFTDKILKPLLNAITPPTSPGLGVQLVPGKNSTLVDFASLVTTAINFIIVAAVVVVLPMHTIQERRKRGEESGPAEPPDVALLKEIRDLLRVQAGQAAAYSAPDGPELFTQPRQPVPPAPGPAAPDPAAAPGRPIGLLGESEPAVRGRGDGSGPGSGGRQSIETVRETTPYDTQLQEPPTSPPESPQPPAHSTGGPTAQSVPPRDQGPRRSR